MPTVVAKVCAGCGEGKLLTEFHKKHDGKYGRDARCADCKNELRRNIPESPRHSTVQIRVNRRVHDLLRSEAQRQGVPVGRLTTLLIAYGLKALREGRFRLPPA